MAGERFATYTGTGTQPNANYERRSATSTSIDQRPGPRPACDHCAGVTVDRASTTTTGCRDLTGDGRVV
ncbi:MAG: hypothetical protein QOJ56_479 [Mycobacterium sp.]|jgi:hypothetical protein|nr:hypothetical protein [Mycobacterium sp.]MDT5351947.1 hypothetical protein [Mycobacterium sp.]MDT7720506.1 hypothetical protein [Mycobacterium sp.]